MGAPESVGGWEGRGEEGFDEGGEFHVAARGGWSGCRRVGEGLVEEMQGPAVIGGVLGCETSRRRRSVGL